MQMGEGTVLGLGSVTSPSSARWMLRSALAGFLLPRQLLRWRDGEAERLQDR